LVATREYSDYTFKVTGGEENKVHGSILAAKSPVFRDFPSAWKGKLVNVAYSKLSSLCLGSRLEDHDELKSEDEFTKLALRDAIVDVLAFCYLDTYYTPGRDARDDFHVRLSHLLTYTLAHPLCLSSLVDRVEQCFKAPFARYCAIVVDTHVIATPRKCFS
ncbi:hypothetical protein BKA63DRAFT_377035, partial [Paraphoma chrysanthemicola]